MTLRGCFGLSSWSEAKDLRVRGANAWSTQIHHSVQNDNYLIHFKKRNVLGTVG